MEIKLQKRTRPSDKSDYTAHYPVYNFHWLPMRTLWGANTREYTWLFWSLLITGIGK